MAARVLPSVATAPRSPRSEDARSGYHLLAFEADLLPTLRRFPMCVRHKLDVSGARLALAEWQQLPVATRFELMEFPIRTMEERALFRRRVAQLARAAMAPEPDEGPYAFEAFPWSDATFIPENVAMHLAQTFPALSLTVAQWAAFSELERYALVKLSRSGHANRGFEALVAELFRL